MRFYHITETSLVPQILLQGLVPAIGPRSEALGEEEAVIWLFPNKDEMENALSSWLGQWFEENHPDGEDVQLSAITLDISEDMVEQEIDSNGVPFYECHCHELIPPDMFVEIRDGY